MPELPEVETTVRGLKNEVAGKKITDFWTDWPKYYEKGKLKKNGARFRRCVVGKSIEKIERMGKNIIIHLSENKAVLIHQKISGHLLVGNWEKGGDKQSNKKWAKEKIVPQTKEGVLWDEKNRFIRFIFYLEDPNRPKELSLKKQLAFSDLRRFGKIICGTKEEIMGLPEIKSLGLDPTKIVFQRFNDLFKGKKTKIKPLLLNQNFVAGIGNIYSDEILWRAKIHPATPANKRDEAKRKKIFTATKKVLERAIALGGTSTDDYRSPEGKKGGFGKRLMAYQRTGQPCLRCETPIKRIVMVGRGTHLCPHCQKYGK